MVYSKNTTRVKKYRQNRQNVISKHNHIEDKKTMKKTPPRFRYFVNTYAVHFLFGTIAVLSFIFLLKDYDLKPRIISALLHSAIFTWLILSTKHYGIQNTAEFIVMTPMALVSIFLSLGTNQKNKKITIYNVLSPQSFLRFDNAIEEAINEHYAGKIQKNDPQEDGYYVHVHIPYGIHPDYAQITKNIAKTLHIPSTLILQSEFSPTSIYYFFSLEALTAYANEENKKYPWLTWEGFSTRLLLRE